MVGRLDPVGETQMTNPATCSVVETLEANWANELAIREQYRRTRPACRRCNDTGLVIAMTHRGEHYLTDCGCKVVP